MNTQTFLSVQDALKNHNQGANQNIKSQFVAQHVHANVNSMVEFILNSETLNRSIAPDKPFDWEDVENLSTYPEFYGEYADFEGGTYEELQEEIERLNDLAENDSSTLLLEEIESLEDLETEPQDIFEWWLVSDYLCEKLKEKGCCVIDSENIWGRTTTGQAILLDYVIGEICAEMEILEGQRNSWA